MQGVKEGILFLSVSVSNYGALRVLIRFIYRFKEDGHSCLSRGNARIRSVTGEGRPTHTPSKMSSTVTENLNSGNNENTD